MRPIGWLLAVVLGGASCCWAQSQPQSECALPDGGFARPPGAKLQIAEVAAASAVALEECGSPKGCLRAPARRGTPVLIYRVQGDWTCGFFTSRHGAGPAWIRSTDVRILPYALRPPLTSWEGLWAGGEERVRIGPAPEPGRLHLEGHGEWHGANDNVHFGDFRGEATPEGNRVHFVEHGPNSCTIDLTLLGRYILASDNQMCGGMNVRFQGIWKRVAAAPER